METYEFKEFVEELKKEWRTLWRDRIDDKVMAEGIASNDYSLLFVERGLVIVATRDYKPLDFFEILQRHRPPELGDGVVIPSPSVGGWGKFVREVLRSKPKRVTRRGRPVPSESKRKERQQLKKGGRGWLHFRT